LSCLLEAWIEAADVADCALLVVRLQKRTYGFVEVVGRGRHKCCARFVICHGLCLSDSVLISHALSCSVRSCPNLSGSVMDCCPDLYDLVRVCPNLSGIAPFCPALSRLVTICHRSRGTWAFGVRGATERGLETLLQDRQSPYIVRQRTCSLASVINAFAPSFENHCRTRRIA